MAQIEGQSFAWIFFAGAAIWLVTQAITGPDSRYSWFVLASMMAVPFALQLIAGYALNPYWIARYSRTRNPVSYWFWVSIYGLGAALLFTRAAFFAPTTS